MKRAGSAKDAAPRTKGAAPVPRIDARAASLFADRPLTAHRVELICQGLDAIGCSAATGFVAARVLRDVQENFPAPRAPGPRSIELLPPDQRRGLRGGVAVNWFTEVYGDDGSVPVLDAPDGAERVVRVEISGSGDIAVLVGQGTIWARRGDGTAGAVPGEVWRTLRSTWWRARYGKLGALIASATWRWRRGA